VRPARDDPGGRAIVAGIVLAGGRARRFGSDKLAASYRGRPLLWHALSAVARVAGESVLVLAPGMVAPVLPPLDPAPAVVHDPLPEGGPLVGLLAGLRSTPAPVAVVIGGDMPLVRVEVLRLLAERVAADPGVAAVALLEDERIRPLPCAVRVGPARAAAERLVGDGERSLRSLLGALGAVGVAEAEWRDMDPEGSSLRDVDTPDDLPALDDAPSRRPR
jgi:molybdopterin-guanine dinucleotide biosynthesis protein A